MVPQGGPDHRPARASAHRPRLRHRPLAGEPPVLHHEVRPRPELPRDDRRRTPAREPGPGRAPSAPRRLPRDLWSPGLRPFAGSRAPRPLAGQHPRQRAGRGDGRGLGPGEGDAPRGTPEPIGSPRPRIRPPCRRRRGRSSGPPPTCPPSRHWAISTRSTCGPMSMDWERSCSRSSPANHPSRAGAPSRRCTRIISGRDPARPCRQPFGPAPPRRDLHQGDGQEEGRPLPNRIGAGRAVRGWLAAEPVSPR